MYCRLLSSCPGGSGLARTQPLLRSPHLHGIPHGPSASWSGHSSGFTGVTPEHVHGRAAGCFSRPCTPLPPPCVTQWSCPQHLPALLSGHSPSALPVGPRVRPARPPQAAPCSPGLLHSHHPHLSLLSGTSLLSPPGLISPTHTALLLSFACSLEHIFQ